MSGHFDRNIWACCCHCICNRTHTHTHTQRERKKTPRDALRGRIEDFRWTEIKNNIVRTHSRQISHTVRCTFAHTPPKQAPGRQAGRGKPTNEHSVHSDTKQQEIPRHAVKENNSLTWWGLPAEATDKHFTVRGKHNRSESRCQFGHFDD